jgi:hypothetical protein
MAVTGGLRRVSMTLASGSAQNRLPDLTSTTANRVADEFAPLAIVVN